MVQNDEFINSFYNFNEGFNRNEMLQLWQKCLASPPYKGHLMTVHSDILPTNILLNNGNLSAIIDFSYVGLGDLAIDLIPAWSIFDPQSREIFLRALDVDSDTVIRGMGWALSMAVIAIPYYKQKDSPLYDIGIKILTEIFNY